MMSVEGILNVTIDTPKSEVLEQAGSSNILVAVIGFLSFFSVLGTFGNLLVLYVYVRKRNKLASTVFIITLAGTDFVTCVIIIPYTIVLEYVKYNVRLDFACKFYMFLITSNVPFSAFIMTAIAFDRYLCICHPFTHLLNKRMAKLVITVLASIAFTLGIITALNYGVYHINTGLNVNDTALNISSGMNTTLQNSFLRTDGNTSLDDTTGKLLEGKSNSKSSNVGSIVYSGICQPNGILFSFEFTDLYQKIYSSFFVIVIIVVIVLYVLIYRFVSVRRARRRRMRSQSSMYSSCRETAVSYVNTRASINNGCVKTEVDMDSVMEENVEKPKVVAEKSEKTEFLRRMTIREKGLVANIRTASMLFVVTAVFIIVFLPAWLMAHQVLPYNMLIFYMYFFYNVANPIIYAFMNKAFRRDLKDVIECRIT
ncbi:hypothetical protein ACF0H5_019275 [Mactra antiquata]